jgi:hypothetical protein
MINNDRNILILEESLIYVFLIGLSQIFISIIGAGDADLAKHVFLYNLSFDLMVLFTISSFLKDKSKKERS